MQQTNPGNLMGSPRLPDFFIAGAAKAGTTSLWRYLIQHPSIFMPEDAVYKEPGFFSCLRPFNDREAYLRLFEDAAPGQRVGEASGAYLTSPDSAQRIQADIPDAQVIIMLRNPADRAFSLYQWMTQNGYEHAPTFDEALLLEEERMRSASFKRSNPEYYYNYLYYHSGLYSRQIDRYLSAFGEDQVEVLIFEEFIDAPEKHTQKVYQFLRVDPDFRPVTRVHNRSRSARAPRAQVALREFVEPTLNTLGLPGRHRLLQIARSLNEKKRVQLDKTTRAQLLRAYRDDIRATGQLLDRDLSSIWL